MCYSCAAILLLSESRSSADESIVLLYWCKKDCLVATSFTAVKCHWLLMPAILPTCSLVFLVVLSQKSVSVHAIISIYIFLLQILACPLSQRSALTATPARLSVFLN